MLIGLKVRTIQKDPKALVQILIVKLARFLDANWGGCLPSGYSNQAMVYGPVTMPINPVPLIRLWEGL